MAGISSQKGGEDLAMVVEEIFWERWGFGGASQIALCWQPQAVRLHRASLAYCFLPEQLSPRSAGSGHPLCSCAAVSLQ